MENNFPCTCGHKLTDHYPNEFGVRWGCDLCFQELATQTVWQHVFRVDNLKYLEDQYDKSNK